MSYEEKSAYSVYPAEVRADLDDEIPEKAWEYTEEIAAGQNGKWLEFPNGCRGAMVEIEIAGSGEGYVEATGQLLNERVRAGSATGKPWDQGTVSGTTQDYVVPVTAIRGVNISGTIRLNVRLQ